ncbi:Putative Dicer-2 protein [Rhizopus microsporus]|nr:Putative Dicer-2 protein [Rhizopus microsporus]
MLIKHMAALEREARLTRRETKLAFFLVDRVPLVFQQASVIKANCDIVVEAICGEMDVDNWSEKRWKIIFEESDVCVMTAQIFLDALYHGFLSIDRAHLIVFDECHHATKRHPFNLIMREFYDRCPAEKRPKIFGMTASPVHSKNDVENSVAQLEKNLDAKVYTASNMEQITTFKVLEITALYNPAPIYEETALTGQIREKIGSIPKFSRCFTVARDILAQLGPWCCDVTWKYMLSGLERHVARQTQDLGRESLLEDDLALKNAHELVDNMEIPRNPDIYDISLFSPKITKLIQILQIITSGTQQFCGIVFVERRNTAVAIQLLIQSLDSLSKLRAGILTGHGSSEEGHVQMHFKEQNKTIQKFRTGEINLLIATNVAEEGLDIQPCNFVIRFDFFHTLISYIQSRGRARCSDSKFVIMAEQKNHNQTGIIDDFRTLENSMKQFCQALPADRNVANKFGVGDDGYASDEEDYDSDEDFMESAIIDLETGATVTKQNAVPLIHRYCSSLPSDSFCVLKPIFEYVANMEGYRCILSLPSNAAIQQVESPFVRSKKLAKALAALQACDELKQVDALDKHLLPRNLKKEILGEMAPQYDENGYIIGSRRRHGLYEKRTPKFWERIVETEEEFDVEHNEDLLKATRIANHSTEADGKKDVENEGSSPVKVTEMDVDGSTKDNPIIETLSKVSELQINNDHATENNKEVQKDKEETEEELDEGPFSMWFTILEVEMENHQFEERSYRRLCLVTKKPFITLPQLRLFHKSKPFAVNIRNLQTELVFDRDTVVLLSDYTLKLLKELMNKEYHCPMIDIPYFIVPLVKNCEETKFEELSADDLKNLVDWSQIQAIVDQANKPLDLSEIEDPTDIIVIDNSDHFRRYLVKSIRYDVSVLSPVPQGYKIREESYATFKDFYNELGERFAITDDQQPMIEVERFKKTMNFLYPGETMAAQLKGPARTFVVPQFCTQYFIKASVFVAMIMVPSIMTRIDSLLLCHDARSRYNLPITDEYLLEAYTMPSASMEMNYERLETLGDSLLKFIATIRLYINFPFSNEGELHHLRIRVVCNRALYRAAKRLKFYRYVTSQAFNRRYWRPPHFTCTADNPETLEMINKHRLSDKTLADIVEASLGAAYLCNGLEGCLQTAIQLQIPFDQIEKWSDFNVAFEESRKTVPPRAESKALRMLNLPKLQALVEREFKKPLLLVEALTHASLPNSAAPCYQRLEFLGDAILDFLVIKYLFTKFPDADPGTITTMKDSCVNNQVLGIICLNNGLHKHIIHYSGRLVRSIETLEQEVDDMKKGGRVEGEYWRNLNIPKVLSDVVESMLGAVFVDAEFDLEPCSRLFEKWFVPLFNEHVTPELIRIHPMRKLLTYLQNFGCESFMLRNHTTGSTGSESQKCVMFLHDKPLACGADWNIKVARRHAAEKAYERLIDEPELLETVCNCRISRIKRGLLPEREVEDVDDDADLF